MKSILKSIFILSLIISTTNCSKDDDSSNIDNQLLGSWELREINKMELGTIEIEANQIIWIFNSNGKLIVTNNLTDSGIRTSGEYNYSTGIFHNESLNQDVSSIYINETKEGEFYKVINDSLILDYGSYVDAPIYTFVRKN